MLRTLGSSFLLIACACGGDSGGADSDGGDSNADARPNADARVGPGGSIQFFGNGGLDSDRVKIPVDPAAGSVADPAVDIGDDDFTIEFWFRANDTDNPNPAINCGNTNDWVTSNIIIDRDRHSLPRSFGIGFAGGVVIFAVTGEAGSHSLCGTSFVLDDQWHHIAAQRDRSTGRMQIFVDGTEENSADGPTGDISYPPNAMPTTNCPDGLCDYSDPYLVFGAEKHGYTDISYSGLLDEVRISTVLRYTDGDTIARAPHDADADTVALYHFDSGGGTTAVDSSAAAGGPYDGTLNIGGDPEGPVWSTETPF